MHGPRFSISRAIGTMNGHGGKRPGRWPPGSRSLRYQARAPGQSASSITRLYSNAALLVFLVAYYDLLDGCHIPLEVSCLPSIGTLLPGLGPAMGRGKSYGRGWGRASFAKTRTLPEHSEPSILVVVTGNFLAVCTEDRQGARPPRPAAAYRPRR
jgi:hypothetical protein